MKNLETHTTLGRLPSRASQEEIQKLAQTFISSFRYIDGVLSLNNSRFGDYLHRIYPDDLKVNDTTDTQKSASYLDLHLEIDSDERLKTKLYDKRQDCTFPIVNFPFISSNIPASPAYGVYISQCDSSELREELCPVSSSLPLRVHKVYIRVSFSDTFLRWLPPFATTGYKQLSLSTEKKLSLLYLTGQWLRVNFIFYVITDHCLARLGLFIRS